jgi:hypothetical protein
MDESFIYDHFIDFLIRFLRGNGGERQAVGKIIQQNTISLNQ